ncbi:MAG: hypothetical protein LBR81_00970 [Prevotellaceae bacterium]|jgi:copper chaperone CopZ|nr:hypothetical protein [Prevotellaceae bacterium]
MKRILSIALIALVSISAFAAKKSVSFNAMMSGKKGEKAVKQAMKSVSGVTSVKTDGKTGVVDVFYDDKKTNIAVISNAFKTAGIYASPIGENCALKPGGCLNNAPTTTNTMR